MRFGGCLTSVAPDSRSCSTLGMFSLAGMKGVFSRAGSIKFSFRLCFEVWVTLHDRLRMPKPRHRLPVNWGR